MHRLASLKKDVWQSESELRKLRYSDVTGFYLIRNIEVPHFKYVQGVKGKFWLPKGVEFCRAEGIEPDLKKRPCPPQGKDMLSKLMRSYYKRRMKVSHLLDR